MKASSKPKNGTEPEKRLEQTQRYPKAKCVNGITSGQLDGDQKNRRKLRYEIKSLWPEIKTTVHQTG